MLRMLFLTLGLLPLMTLFAQEDAHTHLRDGDAAYLAEDYAAAEVAYRRALNAQPSGRAQYNLGNTLYRNNRPDEAMQAYAAAAEVLETPAQRAAAYYNLGNAAAAQEDWQQAVDAYRNALRIEPNDTATKYNYAQALEKLREQQQQEQEQEEQENQENEENQENQEEQENQEQQEGENENEEQEPQNGEGENEEEQEEPREGEGDEESEQPQQPQDQEIDNDAQTQPTQTVSVSRQQAEELLKIIEREEQKVQEKIRKGKATNRRSDKDW